MTTFLTLVLNQLMEGGHDTPSDADFRQLLIWKFMR